MTLRIHFINVGEGDCTILELPDDKVMIVDIRNGRRKHDEANVEFENPIRYLGKLSRSDIFRYVQSHPDMDHMDGLSDLARSYTITNFWDTENTKPKPEEFGYGFREEDWDAYQTLRKNAKFRLRDTNPIGLAHGGSFPYNVYVLNPSKFLLDEGNKIEDWNLLSYIILIEYEGLKLLLGGDASDAAWESVYNWTQKNAEAEKLLSGVTIFKVSHHGKNSSYCGAEILNLTNPQKIVISKGSTDDGSSAYGKYYNWSGGAKNMLLTSKGTIIADYYDEKNRKYSIDYVSKR